MKKNPTTIFIQLLRTKTLKNKIKKMKKEKYDLNVVASETKKRKKKFVKYIN